MVDQLNPIQEEYSSELKEIKKSFFFRFIFFKRYRLLRYISFAFIINFNEIINIFTGGFATTTYVIEFISCIILHLGLILFNFYVFVPKIFLKGKYLLFLIICYLQESFYTVYTWYIFQDRHDYFQTERFWRYFILFHIIHCIILGFGVGIKIYKYWYFDQIRLKKALKEKHNAELQFLKNQINPHFLFNSLNNILVMHKINHVETEKSIIGFSDLLKYQLYDCSHDKVPLKKEIEYIENYIKLEKIRKPNLEMIFNIIEKDTVTNKFIEPLLFTPFIENAFKHARKNSNKYYIEVELSIQIDYLFFSVKNSKRNNYKPSKIGGIGINNVKRRLELVYENKYDLRIIDGDNDYKVELGILMLNFDVY